MPVGPWITKYSARKAVVADPESQEQVIDEFTITAKSTPPQREQEQEQDQPEQPTISSLTFVSLLAEQPVQPQPQPQQPRRKRRKRTPLGRAGTEFDGQYGDYIEFCDGTRAFVTS
jgi:hypothetical protein